MTFDVVENEPLMEEKGMDALPTSKLSRGRNYIWAHALLVAFYTIISVSVINLYTRETVSPSFDVLPDLDIQFNRRQYGMMHDSPYVGQPSEDVDNAWHDLMGNMSLRVTTEELAQQSQRSVALPNGGYLAWLGAYHDLHCIKILRKMNYRDHYHPNLTEQGLKDQQVHADHCIDALRNLAMCRSDTESMTTFVWRQGQVKPLLSPERPLRRCVDWDRLVGSLKHRVVSEGEMSMMRNPLG